MLFYPLTYNDIFRIVLLLLLIGINKFQEKTIWHLQLKEKSNLVEYNNIMPNNKKNKKTKKGIASKTTISDNVRDHSKDPFVVKKVESSKKVFEKYGFPKFD
ncbi:MAG TPA: hypothetical protein VF008_30835 [Niastella sp.]